MRQLTAFFFCLLILGQNATQINNLSEKQNNILGQFNLKDSEFQALIQDGSSFVVDQVLGLLKNLEDAAGQDIVDLDKAWVVQKAQLEQVLAKATQVYNLRVQTTLKLLKQQHHLEAVIAHKVQETQKNNQTILNNAHKLQDSKAQRCQSNNIYVDSVVSFKDATALFNVLKKAISKATFSLAQIEQVSQTIGEFINIYAQEHTEEFQQIMVQLKQVTSNSRHSWQVAKAKVQDFQASSQYKTSDRVQGRKNVGTGQIDNNSKQIKLEDLDQKTVQSLNQVKAQLTQVLDKLINQANESKSNSDKLEANANEAAAVAKKALQDEQRRLKRRNEKLHRQLNRLAVRLTQKLAEVKASQEQEARDLASKNLAQKNLNDATNAYNKRRAQLVDQQKLFHSLFVYYQEKVYNVASAADRSRVQDFNDNKSFKNTNSYTATTASSFNPLKGKVQSTVESQAVKNIGTQ